jgi:predicted signal transduction protein with EAL and GGDEF domain
VADRLTNVVGEGGTVARLGGDEFAIVQPFGEQPSSASDLARRIVSAIAEPFDFDGQQVVIGASIGIAVAPIDGTDPDQLLRNADLALYRAKADGKGQYCFFEAGMDARAQERRNLELDLRKALALNEFSLAYQPLINLETSELTSFEALIRWHHPKRGIVPPVEFIPLAEELGLIGAIGAWVLKEACSAAMQWPKHVRVAVNLSPLQFSTGTLMLDVIAALGSSGLAANRLELEITESVLLKDTEKTLELLTQLRNLGARISMDDFGTGYSSLGYLQRFPFDKIKIDRSFVQELSSKPESKAIIRAVASLAASLGITTTAEGVESLEQLQRLKQEGCTEAQGYFFSRPKAAGELDAFIRERSVA